MPSQTPTPRTAVLFVCLGNICRSPLAKWVFHDIVRRNHHADRFEIDSCGTGGWHVGEGADPRSVAVARRFGLSTEHAVRQYAPMFDASRFDYLIMMDRANARRVLQLGAPRERVHLIRTFDPAFASLRQAPLDQLPEVPDPYTLPDEAFEEVYWMLHRACTGLHQAITQSSR